MSARSRRKGAAGEREFAARVAELTGVRLVRRLDQCRGGGHDLEPEAGDTSDTARALRRFAIEVKRRRTITDADVGRWWTTEAAPQAERASLAPLLAYRADRALWRVVVPLAAISSGPGDTLAEALHRASLQQHARLTKLTLFGVSQPVAATTDTTPFRVSPLPPSPPAPAPHQHRTNDMQHDTDTEAGRHLRRALEKGGRPGQPGDPLSGLRYG